MPSVPRLDSMVAYCADIGSVRQGNFGWAQANEGDVEETGRDINDLAGAVARDLSAGRPVALGLECPLFVPIRDDPEKLTSRRKGEGNRPWSAGAGSGSLTVGLVETIWLLRSVRKEVGESVEAYLRWDSFIDSGSGFYLWEAFVTGEAKAYSGGSQSHAEDAAIAVKSFLAALPNPETANAVHEASVHSLIGAALLRTGWTDDLKVLSTPCLVIRS